MKTESATEKILKPSEALFLFSHSKHATFSKIQIAATVPLKG
jgi:hypothetical protein